MEFMPTVDRKVSEAAKICERIVKEEVLQPRDDSCTNCVIVLCMYR